jgi:hypothetical protein
MVSEERHVILPAVRAPPKAVFGIAWGHISRNSHFVPRNLQGRICERRLLPSNFPGSGHRAQGRCRTSGFRGADVCRVLQTPDAAAQPLQPFNPGPRLPANPAYYAGEAKQGLPGRKAGNASAGHLSNPGGRSEGEAPARSCCGGRFPPCSLSADLRRCASAASPGSARPGADSKYLPAVADGPYPMATATVPRSAPVEGKSLHRPRYADKIPFFTQYLEIFPTDITSGIHHPDLSGAPGRKAPGPRQSRFTIHYGTQGESTAFTCEILRKPAPPPFPESPERPAHPPDHCPFPNPQTIFWHKERTRRTATCAIANLPRLMPVHLIPPLPRLLRLRLLLRALPSDCEPPPSPPPPPPPTLTPSLPPPPTTPSCRVLPAPRPMKGASGGPAACRGNSRGGAPANLSS